MGPPASSSPTKAALQRGGGRERGRVRAAFLGQNATVDGRDSQVPPPRHAGSHPGSLPDTSAAWTSKRVDRKIVS